jgi:hypothetical protein
MNAPIKVFLRWLLVVIALAASTFAFFDLSLGGMMWPDRSLVAALSAMGVAPSAAIEALHSLDFFAAILVWVVPPTCAIAFATHNKQRRALGIALSIAALLSSGLFFALGRSESSVVAQWTSAIAGFIVLAALGLSFSKLKFPRMIAWANLLAILLLFFPSARALARSTGAPPEAQQLWSAILQREDWWLQSMNTGSDYASTRQVIFAADRVVAVFNVGQLPYQGKTPMSSYRIVSLDARTGISRSQISFAEPWGAMPYISTTETNQIRVEGDPPRFLNPDLTPVTVSEAIPVWEPKVTPKQAATSNFDPMRHSLSADRTVAITQKQFQVLDKTGNAVSKGNLVQWGNYAGSSANGQRFAIASSDSEGDPDFVIYEYFTIYDSSSGKAVATIHMKELPERQSWSAFSPDGHYFAAGSPSKLTLYAVP